MNKKVVFIAFLLIFQNSFSQMKNGLKVFNNQEMIKILKDYQFNNLIGSIGISEMKLTKDKKYRNFGKYKRAKIKLNNQSLIEKDSTIKLSGESIIYGKKIEKFNGIISNLKQNSYYISNNNLDSKTGIINYDSIQFTEINYKFKFVYKKDLFYEGEIKLNLLVSGAKYELNESGIQLLGYYNSELLNSELNFGVITPSSSGIFRAKNNSQKFCFNKSLLEYGWKSYIYSNPTLFDCLFDSFTDEISPINFTEVQINKYRKEENDLWKN